MGIVTQKMKIPIRNGKNQSQTGDRYVYPSVLRQPSKRHGDSVKSQEKRKVRSEEKTKFVRGGT